MVVLFLLLLLFYRIKKKKKESGENVILSSLLLWVFFFLKQIHTRAISISLAAAMTTVENAHKRTYNNLTYSARALSIWQKKKKKPRSDNAVVIEFPCRGITTITRDSRWIFRQFSLETNFAHDAPNVLFLAHIGAWYDGFLIRRPNYRSESGRRRRGLIN